jgi:hypothetical protein
MNTISMTVIQFMGCLIMPQLSIGIAFLDLFDYHYGNLQKDETPSGHKKNGKPIGRGPSNYNAIHGPPLELA